ncbi:hypothetical protein [Pseudomonas alliivorans]|nr:hypothetical protein [Pseudomonas alliivorans]
MINRYAAAAAILLFGVFASYLVQFRFNLGYGISEDPAVWGQLGDYFGGLLNPMLSFISLVLLIKSLTLQNQANKDLRSEIVNARKSERMRSFEIQLFNMIDSQRTSLGSLSFTFEKNGALLREYGSNAIIRLEDEVERLRINSLDVEEVTAYLEEIDATDQVFGVTRVFYNMVRMISDKLSDSNGFSLEDRRSHYLTLINFTDFALLRLVVMSAQFMRYPSTEYLKNSEEFNAVLSEVGLSYDLY